MPRRTCERQSQNASLLASARNLVCFALVIIDVAPASRRHWHEWALSVPLVRGPLRALRSCARPLRGLRGFPPKSKLFFGTFHERRVTAPHTVGRSPRDRRHQRRSIANWEGACPHAPPSAVCQFWVGRAVPSEPQSMPPGCGPTGGRPLPIHVRSWARSPSAPQSPK